MDENEEMEEELTLHDKNQQIIEYIEDMAGMGWETMEDFNKVLSKIDRAFMGFTGRAVSKKQVGACGVDSGTLIIIDPCYLKYMPKSVTLDRNWGRWCDNVLIPKTGSPDLGGQVSYGGGGVLASSGGDGSFPVFIYYDELGCVAKIEIKIQP